MNKNQIIANYHYVENPADDRKGIWPCSVAEFERQIKYLSDNFRIVSVEEIYLAAQNNSSEKLAAITFDDGLKDQYLNALPILRKYKATATFFPITGTLDGKYIPATHKIHLSLSHFEIKNLIEDFNKVFPQYLIPTDGSRINKERRLFEEPNFANFKETMLLMPVSLKNNFLESVKLPVEAESAKELFLSEEELKDLDSQGFSIGCHSHLHDVFLGDDKEAMRQDIRTSKEVLHGILGKFPSIFSYPNGRYNDAVIEILKDEGFKYALSIEVREVSKGDNQYAIPRLDTNDIKKMMS